MAIAISLRKGEIQGDPTHRLANDGGSRPCGENRLNATLDVW